MSMNVVIIGVQVVLALGVALVLSLLLGLALVWKAPVPVVVRARVRNAPVARSADTNSRFLAGLLSSTPSRGSPPPRARQIDYFQRLVSRKL
jgi:hypothetical protein